jgi:ATP-binding protein involved in chromosome partitioning
VLLEQAAKIKAHVTQLPNCALKQIKNTIAISSGKGGVGKSTVAVNLAVALAKTGAQVGLLDADIYGPSTPLMMGTQTQATVEADHYQPLMLHGVQTMSIGFITPSDQALIWRGPMLAKAMIQMLDGTAWKNLDYLIIDLPPGTGDIQLSLVQKIPLTAAIVVTTPQAVATLDADKAIQMFQKTNIHVLGLIENMSTHTCTACGHEDALFGQGGAKKLCDAHALPLLGTLPLTLAIREAGDNGQPSALQEGTAVGQKWKEIALNVGEQLGKLPVSYSHHFSSVKLENL